jgi:hypothetical protein
MPVIKIATPGCPSEVGNALKKGVGNAGEKLTP